MSVAARQRDELFSQRPSFYAACSVDAWYASMAASTQHSTPPESDDELEPDDDREHDGDQERSHAYGSSQVVRTGHDLQLADSPSAQVDSWDECGASRRSDSISHAAQTSEVSTSSVADVSEVESWYDDMVWFRMRATIQDKQE